MKTDLYTKIVLSVIAVSLSFIAFQKIEFIQPAKANGSAFAAVPVNPDGSINVKFSETMKVNLSEVGGNYIYNSVPINVKELDGSSISGSYGLPVNIKALSSSSIYDALPVKMKN